MRPAFARMVVLLLCLAPGILAMLVGAPRRARAAPAPSALPAASASALPAGPSGSASASGSASPPPPEGISFDGGTLRSVKDGVVQWRYEMERSGRGEGPPSFPAPVSLGRWVVFCEANVLLEARADTGEVLRRLPLAGRCRSLSASQEKHQVQVIAGEPMSREANPWKQVLQVEPGVTTPRFFVPSPISLALSGRHQALLLSAEGIGPVGLDPEAVRSERWKKEELRPELESALRRLEELQKQDPTNPWYPEVRGEYELHLGQSEAAHRAFQETLTRPASSDYELVILARYMAPYEPALAEQAFERGYRFIQEHGYEPELNFSAATTMLYLGKFVAPAEASAAAVSVAQERYAERLFDFAPYSEGATYLYQTRALRAHEAGDAPREALWRARAASAEVTRWTGVVPPMARHIGLLLELVSAGVLALFFVGVVKILRTFSSRFVDPAGALSKVNLLSRWTRQELVGYLLASALLLGLAYRVHVAVSCLGIIVSAPLATIEGGPGNPAGLPVLATLSEADLVSDDARLWLAIAYQQAGDRARARALYEKLPGDPRALVNRALLERDDGKKAEGDALLAQAAALPSPPSEALFDKGAPVPAPSERVERALRYKLSPRLLALPSPSSFGDLWLSLLRRARHTEPSSVWLSVLSVLLVLDDQGLPLSLNALSYVVLSFMGLALLALFTNLVERKLTAPRAGRFGWWLSWLVPGAARSYSVAGPLVTWLFAFMLLAFFGISQTHGAALTPFDQRFLLNTDALFGPTSVVPDLLEHRVLDLLHFSWVLVLVHGLVMVLAERRSRDPAGPWRREDTPT